MQHLPDAKPPMHRGSGSPTHTHCIQGTTLVLASPLHQVGDTNHQTQYTYQPHPQPTASTGFGLLLAPYPPPNFQTSPQIARNNLCRTQQVCTHSYVHWGCRNSQGSPLNPPPNPSLRPQHPTAWAAHTCVRPQDARWRGREAASPPAAPVLQPQAAASISSGTQTQSQLPALGPLQHPARPGPVPTHALPPP